MSLSKNSSSLLSYSNLQVPSSQVVLFYTEWNEDIVNELLNGAKRVLAAFSQVQVTSYAVPGCVELTHAIKQHSLINQANAYIALGCVIKGDTPHFDYVCQSVTQGITSLNASLSCPIIFGVLTVNTIEQALERIGGKHGHKGEEAAIAALKMIAIKELFLADKSKDNQ